MKNLFLALTLFGSCSLFAADGSSGCGPGWYLFKENSLVSSAFRATTNGILFPSVTFGMTFGTSNCTQHKLVLKEKESLHFVTENYFEVQADMARGAGQYLSTLGQTLGCDASAIPYFEQKAKDHFKTLYKSDAKPEGVLLETYKMILNDQKLLKACSLG